MRIAILFSGRINKYDEHRDNILQRVVRHHHVDFFLSHNTELNENVDDFIRMYRPIAVNREKYPYKQDYSSLVLHPQTNMNNFMSMWFHRKRAFECMVKHMETTNTMYDLCISWRLDAHSDELLDIEQIIRDYKQRTNTGNMENVVFVPEGDDWGGLNDQLAFGDFYPMQTYMLLFHDIWILMTEQHRFGPETILLGHLVKNDVNIWRFPFRYRLRNGKLYH